MSAKCNTDYEKTVFIPDNGILLGTSYNSVISEQDINDLQSFEQWSGKKYSIVVIFQGFSPDEQTPFPKTQLNNIWLNSNTPLLTLEPWGSNIIDEINNGTLDPYLEEYAISLENWTQENWAVYTTPNDNRNNIDDCSFESNKRIIQYQQNVTDPYYVYQFPLYTAPKGDLDGDGKVTGFDIPIVLGLVFDQEYISEADTDDNGYVNIIDVRRITQEINK